MKKLLRRSRGMKAAAITGALALTLSVSSCGAGGDPLAEDGNGNGESAPADTIVVGSADFPENQTIAEIYAGALNADGVEASTRPSIGSREALIGALEDGTIGVTPEYAGNLLTYFDADATNLTAEQILQELPEKLPQGLQILDASEAQNKDAMVVTKATAEQYSLRTVEDLAKVCDELVMGAPPEFAERAYGLPGLKSDYDCVPKSFEPMSGAVLEQALIENRVQVADIFTTTPAIKENDLVVLDDPKNLFMANQVLPLIRDDKTSQQVTDTLNKVSSELTTDDLISLNQKVSGEAKMNPKDAAAEWLKEKGFTS